MAAIRYLVSDVDAALPFYLALGFAEVERWEPRRTPAVRFHDPVTIGASRRARRGER